MAAYYTAPATSRSLLIKIRDPLDDEAWHEFYHRYQSIIHRVAMSRGLSDDEAQEVVQETMLSVKNKIGQFDYDPAKGKFKAWLLTLVGWRIDDQFRKRDPRVLPLTNGDMGTQRTPAAARVPDPHGCDLQSLWDKEWTQTVLETALARIKKRVSSLDYQIYDLRVLKDLPVKQVCQMLDVSRPKVDLTKFRVGRLLAKEIRRLENCEA